MKRRSISAFFLILPAALLLVFSQESCREKKPHRHLGEKVVVQRPEELKQTVTDVIESALEDAVSASHDSRSFPFANNSLMQELYRRRQFAPMWTRDSSWLSEGERLLQLLRTARCYGLFPEDYRSRHLDSLHRRTRFDTSRSTRLNAALWAEADLYLTSALLELATDLRAGRLQADSTRMRDSSLNLTFYSKVLDSFRIQPVDSFTRWLEPRYPAYHELKTALQRFLEKARFRRYTRLDAKDSLRLPALIRKRLAEDSLFAGEGLTDSAALAAVLKKYQRRQGLKPDGKVSPELIQSLNRSDWDKFEIIALNLDRYKQLPPLPAEFIWVNIPTYQLQVFRADTVSFTTRVVVGKPETRTPVLASAINNMMTYPQWTIPPGIIAKEILPALQRDPGYLARKGYSLLDSNRNEVDPRTVKWSRYKKGIPYKVVQGSGDDNALGVLKFNFPNKFSVYLHDTNQRGFFGRSKRALSHGCVRVENWHGLATYLLERDSLLLAMDSVSKARPVPVDSLNSWLAQKKRKWIPLRRTLPVFLRYITCVGRDGSLLFYEDIYGEDRRLRQAWLTRK